MNEPAEETLIVAAVLSGTGGFLDAFTYIGHGGVFANAMTGNVVLLGAHAALGHWDQAARHLPPLIAFAAGVFAAARLRLAASRAGTLAGLALEIACLALLAFLPAATADAWITLPISFAAAIQNSGFTRVRGRPYNSVMTTGNLRRSMDSLFKCTLDGPDPGSLQDARLFATLCTAFLIGAAAGAPATAGLANAALAIPATLLAAVLTFCLFRRNRGP